MLNVIVLMGRLVADPELRHTPNDIPVCSFRVAVDRNFVAKGSNERQADFIDIVAWRQSAEFVSRYFTKGSMIAVQGSLQTRSYEDKQGNRRTAFEVVADHVSFCGSKRESGGSAYGGERTSSYENRAPAYDRGPAFGQDNAGGDGGFGVPTFPADPAPAAFTSGGDNGFEEIMGDDDLPF